MSFAPSTPSLVSDPRPKLLENWLSILKEIQIQVKAPNCEMISWQPLVSHLEAGGLSLAAGAPSIESIADIVNQIPHLAPFLSPSQMNGLKRKLLKAANDQLLAARAVNKGSLLNPSAAKPVLAEKLVETGSGFAARVRLVPPGSFPALVFEEKALLGSSSGLPERLLERSLARLVAQERWNDLSLTLQEKIDTLPASKAYSLALAVGKTCLAVKKSNAAASALLLAHRLMPSSDQPLSELTSLYVGKERPLAGKILRFIASRQQTLEG